MEPAASVSLLEARDLSKRYGAVVALRSATLVVEPGEIHALLGANGAGKSTLVKMLTGVTRPDSGTIVVQGAPVRIASPLRAQRHGLAVVFQDPALAPDMTVRQNLRLTGTNIREVRRWLGEMDFNVDLSASVQDVPLPALRLLDLARALSRDPRLLMLDEITAALPSDLAERVFAIMKQWREQGRSVLFITHRLAEVTALCDRATPARRRGRRRDGALGGRRGADRRDDARPRGRRRRACRHRDRATTRRSRSSASASR